MKEVDDADEELTFLGLGGPPLYKYRGQACCWRGVDGGEGGRVWRHNGQVWSGDHDSPWVYDSSVANDLVGGQ